MGERERDKAVDRLIEELDKMLNDPELIKQAEEFHREITGLTAEELMRPFTIP